MNKEQKIVRKKIEKMLNEEIVQHDNGDTNHFILKEGQGKLDKER